ncbi:protein dithiol oxidoreductase (disulfide-forming) [Methylomarinovum caldicuralii]|uniref:Thiol:disulfide interchange protein n=2 Tax=Methylomarinovum caldicuralii TaxID=438856 RepID=A0AAU9C3X3_9GAMM|nr:protein dithiol oxidoreductase (disulfide-forming) [Methylomarinovum caldicuralii]
MKAMLRTLFAGWLLLLALPAFAKPYLELNPPKATEDSGKVEVIEFFWYGCPHCYRFDPYLEAWRKKQPADVVFKRQPAIFGPHWAPQARAYFTAETLGVVDKIHKDFFDAMHKQKKRMASEEELAAFFAAHGVDQETFKNPFHSFMVDMKMRQAEAMAPEYGITGVPALVVNGKYLITGRTAGSFEDMIKVLDQLVAQERQKLAAAKP